MASTIMQRAGIDVKGLQYLMGHSKVSMTLDAYIHVDFYAMRRKRHLAERSPIYKCLCFLQKMPDCFALKLAIFSG